jgi:hypothetical protein
MVSNPVQLKPLCVYRAFTGPPSMVSRIPPGRRMLVPVVESHWVGERLSGSQIAPSGGDLIKVTADGTALTNVRLLIRTKDGADVQVTYVGRADWSEGPTTRPVRIAMNFETTSAAYGWLNTILAIGMGQYDGEAIEYKVFEVV